MNPLQSWQEELQAAEPSDLAEFNTKETALIVIDVIRGFVEKGALADPTVAEIIPVINDASNALPLAQTFTLRDCHAKGCREFEVFPEHCLEGSAESELAEGLFLKDAIDLKKNSTNGFFAFLPYLKQYRHLIVTGDCTDICVLQFALTAKGYCNEQNLPVDVVLVANAVDTFGSPTHPKDVYQTVALKLMQNAGIRIVRFVGSSAS